MEKPQVWMEFLWNFTFWTELILLNLDMINYSIEKESFRQDIKIAVSLPLSVISLLLRKDKDPIVPHVPAIAFLLCSQQISNYMYICMMDRGYHPDLFDLIILPIISVIEYT